MRLPRLPTIPLPVPALSAWPSPVCPVDIREDLSIFRCHDSPANREMVFVCRRNLNNRDIYLFDPLLMAEIEQPLVLYELVSVDADDEARIKLRFLALLYGRGFDECGLLESCSCHGIHLLHFRLQPRIGLMIVGVAPSPAVGLDELDGVCAHRESAPLRTVLALPGIVVEHPQNGDARALV